MASRTIREYNKLEGRKNMSVAKAVEYSQQFHEEALEEETQKDASVHKMSQAGGTFLVAAAVAVISVFISFKAINEVKSIKQSSLQLMDAVDRQKYQIALWEEYVTTFQANEMADREKMDGQMSRITESLKNNETDISEMVIDISLLRQKIKSLDSENQQVIDQLIDLNSTLNEIKTAVKNTPPSDNGRIEDQWEK